MLARTMRVAVVAGLFFLSGLTALVYQVIWSRYLALLLGSTAHAQVGVLAVFMAGLALGSAWWGPAADRNQRPLRLYGLLELAVAAGTAAFALGFSWWSELYWSLLARFPPPHWGARATQVLLCVAAMAAPTICMGGTLPVLVRALRLHGAGFGRGVAFLYMINSLGAATGAALTGFMLVPRWGLDAPFLAAAALNLVVGLVAVSLGRAERTELPPPSESVASRSAPGEVVSIRGYRWLVPLAAAVSGAVAMSYEVVWIRLCSLVLGSSTYAFSIMLTAFILGIASGGLVYAVWGPAQARPVRFYLIASLTSAAVLLACLPFYERLPYFAGRLLWYARQSGWSFDVYQAVQLGFWVAVMFPLTFTSGLVFPALAQAAAHALPGQGRPVGAVLAANTLGTIAGTVAAGLYLMPRLGMQGTFFVAAAATVVLAAMFLAADRRQTPARAAAKTVPLLLTFAAYVWLAPRWDLRLLVAGEFRRHAGIEPSVSFPAYKADFTQTLLYYRDGATGTVSVEQTPEDVVLRVNGKTDATAFGDRRTQLLLGHLSPNVLGKVERALVIGYGSGMTVAALSRYPVGTIDVVEISPEVLEAAVYFRPWVGDVRHDQRIRIHIEDARTFLFRTPHRYDLIISEPSNPWVAGVSTLFSREFFLQARSRLTPGGALLQWFHTYETSDDTVRLVLRSATEQFSDVRLFQTDHADFFLLASINPRTLNEAATVAAFTAAKDLATLGITRWETLLGLELTQRDGLRQLARDGPVHTDRRPILDYWAAQAFYAGTQSNAILETYFRDSPEHLLPAARMPLPALREWATYQDKQGTLTQLNTLRFLVSWLRQDPTDPELHRAAARLLHAYPRYLSPMKELVAVAREPDGDPVARVRALMTILRLGPQPVNERFLSLLAPVVAELTGRSGQIDLEIDLAELYVEARNSDTALQLLDRTEGLRGMARHEELSRRACIRARALQELGRWREALMALDRCEPADPVARQRVAHQRRSLQQQLGIARDEPDAPAPR